MAKKRSEIKSKAIMGRPPIPFYPEYCEMLIKHMSDGFSFEAFGKHVKCGKETLYSWLEKYQDFSDAKRIGEAASRHWWEEKGAEGVCGLIPGFNASAYIFTMKNKFGWRDQIDANIRSEHTNKNINVNITTTVNELTNELKLLLDGKEELEQLKDVTPIKIKAKG